MIPVPANTSKKLSPTVYSSIKFFIHLISRFLFPIYLLFSKLNLPILFFILFILIVLLIFLSSSITLFLSLQTNFAIVSICFDVHLFKGFFLKFHFPPLFYFLNIITYIYQNWLNLDNIFVILFF